MIQEETNTLAEQITSDCAKQGEFTMGRCASSKKKLLSEKSCNSKKCEKFSKSISGSRTFSLQKLRKMRQFCQYNKISNF